MSEDPYSTTTFISSKNFSQRWSCGARQVKIYLGCHYYNFSTLISNFSKSTGVTENYIHRKNNLWLWVQTFFGIVRKSSTKTPNCFKISTARQLEKKFTADAKHYTIQHLGSQVPPHRSNFIRTNYSSFQKIYIWKRKRVLEPTTLFRCAELVGLTTLF